MDGLELVSVFFIAALGFGAGCSASEDEPSKNGGGATCASTCAQSIALDCAAGEHDQDACEQSCAAQRADCDGANQSQAFQAYLDCVEEKPMECGSSTDAPSSPECLQQGLAILACASGGGSGGSSSGTGGTGSGSGGTSSGSGTGMTGDPCAHDEDCLGYRRCKNGTCAGVTTCTNDGSCGGLRCYSDPEAGLMCWYDCATDADCADTGYADYTVCTDGWCAKP